ncbi:MAG TPA: HNH endonuclease [Opitutaceae bacterium]|nr:HNH endonuclease [Opitutaceae bacterium]
MSFWIFKVAEQELYPDKAGEEYVFDNTHSIRVKAGDEFLYLDKKQGYSFTASGVVARISTRQPTEREKQRTAKVRTVYTAHLTELLWFASPLAVSPSTKAGRKNRAELGIVDLNLLGWSQSIPQLSDAMFSSILALAEPNAAPDTPSPSADFSVDDNWAKTKVRRALTKLRRAVFARDGRSCIICGIHQIEVLEVAHLSSYSSDKQNRANPANAICLCAFCHKALDRRLVGFCPDGSLFVSSKVVDPLALVHFSKITAENRRPRLREISPAFLAKTVEWAKAVEIG